MEPVGQPSGRWMCKGKKEKEAADLAKRRTVESSAQASWWTRRKWVAVLKPRANLPRSLKVGGEKGWR